ncbi:MAG: NAD(P)/FAD-dependent oxidoreductase, partial [Thermomicrobiales bacterium]
MADQANHYEAIVIGSGHNGLIAANYLAREGKRVLVLERRDVIGGAAVTESPRPGYNLSTCSYVCNLLLPEVVHDFDLPRHGYEIRAFEPGYFTPFPDGRFFMTFHDDEKTREQIRKFSEKDVAGYDAYWEMWNRILARMQPFLRRELASPEEFADVFKGAEGEDDWDTLTRKSIAEVLDRYIESDEIKAPLSTGGVIGTNAGPFDEGTAYIKFHHLIGTVEGRQGAWGYVRGGMGSITKALASAGIEMGVTIHTSAEVEEIDVSLGRATRVRLTDGRRFTSDVILSNADPQRTFLGMLGREHLPTDYADAIAA